MTQGPVLIDLAGKSAPSPAPSVAEAAPVPDIDLPAPTGQAMQMAARVAGRKPSRLAAWFWGLSASVIGAAISVAAWDFVYGLLDRAPILGWIVAGLLAALGLVLAIIALREVAAISRLGRIDKLHRAGVRALASDDLGLARDVTNRLLGFYRGREDTRWARERLHERMGEQFDAATLLALAEDTLLAPLDKAAQQEVESAARQVATVTALVPIALADVATALVSSLRMIRRVAEMTRQLHKNGVNHRDLYICHFLLQQPWNGDDRSLHLYLIDLHRVQLRKRVPLRWQVKDVASLYFSTMGAGLARRDLFRFLRVYHDQPLRQVLTQHRGFLRAVEKRAMALRAKGVSDE